MSTKNIRRWDRILRIAVGLAMLFAASTGAVEGIWRVALLLFAEPLVAVVFHWQVQCARGGHRRRGNSPGCWRRPAARGRW